MSKASRLTPQQKEAFLKVSGESDIEAAYAKVSHDGALLLRVEAICPTPVPKAEPKKAEKPPRKLESVD